jgi:hypothetical protein
LCGRTLQWKTLRCPDPRQLDHRLREALIEIRDGRVRLVHIFRARLWTSTTGPKDLTTLTYEKLIQVAEDSEVEAELCLA